MAAQASDIDLLISGDPLRVDTALTFCSRPQNGGVALFVGITREFTSGSHTELLEYEAYTEMALAEMRLLAETVMGRWEVTRVVIHHRIGRVPVSEAGVIVAVGAPHRGDALEAARYLIDTLKHSVPIWKKEVYSDGSAAWVAGHSSPTPTSEVRAAT